MALPTSLPKPAETAGSAYARVVELSNGVVSNLTNVRNLILSGVAILPDNLIGLYQNLNNAQAVGQSLQGVEGLADFARSVEGASYDIDAEFMNSIVACMAVTDWLLANMPGDGNGGFINWRHQEDGTIQRVTMPINDLVPLVPLLDAAAATFAKAG